MSFSEYIGNEYEEEELNHRSQTLLENLTKRRSIREFSDRPFSIDIIQNLVKTAATAPSGANKQPWTFCIVSNPEIKKTIRIEAEKEEYESYNNRMSDSWLEDLKPLGTDWKKPFLEIAPYLIVVFKKPYDLDSSGNKLQNYYVNESVGIACGILISAIHQAGLVTLTHTPSPMNFLTEILSRPGNERPYLLLPVGYPQKGTKVPDIKRKSYKEIAVEYL